MHVIFDGSFKSSNFILIIIKKIPQSRWQNYNVMCFYYAVGCAHLQIIAERQKDQDTDGHGRTDRRCSKCYIYWQLRATNDGRQWLKPDKLSSKALSKFKKN